MKNTHTIATQLLMRSVRRQLGKILSLAARSHNQGPLLGKAKTQRVRLERWLEEEFNALTSNPKPSHPPGTRPAFAHANPREK